MPISPPGVLQVSRALPSGWKANVIRLTRLNSHALTVNSDLIKFVENAPDTMLTLTNGEKIVVRESADEVIQRVIEFRRAVLGGLLSAVVDPTSALAASKRPEEDHHLNHSTEDHSRG
ncbi:MAG: flagellar FlbD family protein [Terriglobales bacterium]